MEWKVNGRSTDGQWKANGRPWKAVEGLLGCAQAVHPHARRWFGQGGDGRGRRRGCNYALAARRCIRVVAPVKQKERGRGIEPEPTMREEGHQCRGGRPPCSHQFSQTPLVAIERPSIAVQRPSLGAKHTCREEPCAPPSGRRPCATARQVAASGGSGGRWLRAPRAASNGPPCARREHAQRACRRKGRAAEAARRPLRGGDRVTAS